jgi:hypothetical protein
MKRVALVFALVVIAAAVVLTPAVRAWECPVFGERDTWRADRKHPAPCIFPSVENPCAVHCRPPGLQPQAVPCAYRTACPSLKLPCHGVSYGCNPYPIFR